MNFGGHAEIRPLAKTLHLLPEFLCGSLKKPGPLSVVHQMMDKFFQDLVCETLAIPKTPGAAHAAGPESTLRSTQLDSCFNGFQAFALDGGCITWKVFSTHPIAPLRITACAALVPEGRE